MWIVRSIVAIATLMFKTPVVRLSLFICLGALSKTTAGTFIDLLPMDKETRKIFSWLLFLTLVGFCVEVLCSVLIDDVSIPVRRLLRHLKRRNTPIDDPD